MSESVNAYRRRVGASLGGTGGACVVPFLYDTANEIESLMQPATVHETNTLDYHFFFRYFMQELFGIFRFENFPDEWNYEFFLWNLLCRGWLAIVDSPSYDGWIPQPCVWGAGRNVFAFPTSVLVQNGYFNPEDGRTEFNLFRESDRTNRDSFGVPVYDTREISAYIIKIAPDYAPLADICAQYAGKCASLFATVDNSSILSRNGYILQADNKADSMTLEKAVEGILNGDIIVTIKSKRPQRGQEERKLAEIFESDIRKHYIVGDVLDDLQTINDMFHSAIGFPVVNRAKKERIIQAEQAALNVPASVRPDLWERTLKDSIARFNAATDYNIIADIVYQGKDFDNGTLSEDSATVDNGEQYHT